MKSVKPGRGPSMMSGVVGIAVAVFGVMWTVGAASMGGGMFALFGVVFVVIAVVNVVYSFRNAFGENRYSEYDITDGNEEPDPLNERFGSPAPENDGDGTESVFCPWCGAKAAEGYQYCNKCGKKLP